LKPSNILLDADGRPRVADFGLAKLLQSDSELTLSGAVLGSPNYMPPEQARGKHAEVSPRSDVYALGAILYECLTGRPPFTAATPLETMKLVVEQEPVSPRVLNPALPRDLETICLKCLAKEPADRYATAQEMADELVRFLADESIHARPTGVAERGWRWCRRQPAVATLFAVILIAGFTLLAVLVSGNARVRRALSHALSEGARASNALARAEHEARRAETNAELNRLNLYAAKMYLAHRALAEGNIHQAHRTLAELAPGDGEADLRGFEWRLLWKTASGEQAAIWTGHSNAVLALALSPDGRMLASGGRDAQIRLWDAETGAVRGTTDHAIHAGQVGHPGGGFPRGPFLAFRTPLGEFGGFHRRWADAPGRVWCRLLQRRHFGARVSAAGRTRPRRPDCCRKPPFSWACRRRNSPPSASMIGEILRPAGSERRLLRSSARSRD
jgi:hypothetical protein